MPTKTLSRLRDALLESGSRPDQVQSSADETLARAGLLSESERRAVLRIEPLAEVLFLMITADGELSETEWFAFRGAARGLTANALSDGVLRAMRDQYAERLRQDGQRARLHAIAVTLKPDPNEAENAFCLAAAVALADNRIADSESRLLDDLAGWLEFDADRVARLLGMLTADANEEKS